MGLYDVILPSEWFRGGVGFADRVREVWVVSENVVDQCPLRSLRERQRIERAGKKRKNILIDSEGYLVVLFS